ncbi:glycosyltransferase family 2 protein [Plantactinospora sp. S1510]|uniref:Glycosyltransferase family 2 protein n=1 Tax=Plantactinospora alkalitolerans TaxID=2789879 RepID=A0ABS0H169_9ACTN|nr:glycosyltransferase family 2 protein [Plantactinospora alkalitolerans]MBF9132202.1 glycosyltransferase family 2 protein [Plantactinospora alkalitolerans]
MTASDAPVRRWRADPKVVARAAVDSAVLAHDEFAQTAADVFWEFAREDHCAVAESLRAVGDPEVTAGLDAIAGGVATPATLDLLTATVASRIEGGAPPWPELAASAVRADAYSRLAMHVGHEPVEAAPIAAADLVPAQGTPAPTGASDAQVLVVIPFRDSDPALPRLRNLLACLSALADQSMPRENYRCVVVELDSHARHEDVIRPFVDRYLHVHSTRRFNKSWAVNVGVVAEAGDAEILCILDSDVLVDRDFVRRNLDRFHRRGSQAHWPYLDALCLDPASTDYAVRHRCLLGEAVDLDRVRGVYLRRPPGHCVWLRMPLFMRVRGMDERFEGWGGEDLDFAFRVEFMGSLDRYDDPLLHMFHPRPQVREDGKWFFAERRFLSWRPVDPIGRPDRPARSQDDTVRRPSPADASPDSILS